MPFELNLIQTYNHIDRCLFHFAAKIKNTNTEKVLLSQLTIITITIITYMHVRFVSNVLTSRVLSFIVAKRFYARYTKPTNKHPNNPLAPHDVAGLFFFLGILCKRFVRQNIL